MTPIPTWTIEAWCATQQPLDWKSATSLLSPPSVAFLERLNLPSKHPFCELAVEDYEIPGVPGQGPLLSNDHLETLYDIVVTVFAMGAPSLAAMAELWLRLFAFFLAPLGIAHLLYQELQTPRHTHNNNNKNAHQPPHQSFVSWHSVTCLLTTTSAAILWTDTLYVLEYGPSYGGTLFALAMLLSWKSTSQMHRTRLALASILVVTAMLLYDHDSHQLTFGHPHDTVHIKEGIYYDASNLFTSRIVEQHWPEHYRTYTRQSGATPWFPTGDSRTGLPFLLNAVPSPAWNRVWLPLTDGEVVALDIAFPVAGHDVTTPLYLVLHGLNGGSQEEYVKDFALRRTTLQNSTVVVMIARGLMDLPVRGMDIFHGARWQDAHQAAQTLRQTIVGPQILAGVGYSMGAIVMGNMVTRTGPDCALDVAMAISGGLDMRNEIDFFRAQRLWQPLVATELRDTFVVGKWGERVRRRLTKDQMKALMRATHISEIDQTAVVAYNDYRDLVHYYSDMSALGDVPFPSDEEYAGESLPLTRRIHNVSIPFCVVHALDDPLVTWRTVASNSGLIHPSNLTKTGSGNLFVLLTKRGGHVGWPLGWAPFIDNWKWMSDVSMSFVTAVSKAKAGPLP